MILVVGATGLLGGMITRRLLEQGQEVRVLVRHNSPAEEFAKQGLATAPQSLIDAGAQPVYGDLRDRNSLDRACAGIETVITTANSAARTGEDNVENVDLHGNRSLIDAAKAAGAKHFIFTSASMADADSPVPFVAAKGKTEAYLQASGTPYTILAPNAFMDFWLWMVVAGPALSGQPVTVVGSGERVHSFICMEDVCSFAVASVSNPEAVDQKLVIGGPEPLSFRDATEVFGRVLGQEIPVQSVAPGEPVPGLPESIWGLAAAFDMYDSPMDTAPLADQYGVSLTPFETVARGMAAGAG